MDGAVDCFGSRLPISALPVLCIDSIGVARSPGSLEVPNASFGRHDNILRNLQNYAETTVSVSVDGAVDCSGSRLPINALPVPLGSHIGVARSPGSLEVPNALFGRHDSILRNLQNYA